METTGTTKFTTIDEYISTFPKNLGDLLEEMRETIKEAAPEAEETIAYNMPAFRQHGVLVYFAAYKQHIGFYPTASPMTVFKDELADYKTSKGAIQFPIDKPIPTILVQEIVRFKVKEDLEKAKQKKSK